jgi:predicted Rossmann fold nucleotide-binding protein DprA/Smf involved in DNA uptake
MVEEKTTSGDLITLDVAGRLLMIGPERIRQLNKAGYIAIPKRGFTTIVSAVQGYIRFLKDEERKQTQTGAAERARDARAREIEQKIAERDRRLIPTEEAELVMDLLVGAVAKELDGMAARITRDMAFRRLIEADVHGAKIRIADALQEGKGFARTGRDALEAGGEV